MVQGTNDTFNTIREAQTKYKNDKLKILGVILTLVLKNTILYTQMHKSLKEKCDKRNIKILDIEQGIPNSI